MREKVERTALFFLLSAVAMYFFANFQRSAMPGPIFNELQTGFGLTAGVVTGLGSAFLYAYSGMQLVIGLLTDRYSGCRVLAMGCLIFGAGALLSPLSGSAEMLYFARILTGLGASTVYLSMVREVERLFPRSFTRVLGLSMLVGCLGSFVANSPLIFLADRLGWRPAMTICGGLICLNALLLLYFFRGISKPPLAPGRLSLRPYVETFSTPLVLRLLGAGTVLYAMYNVFLVTIGKKLLEDTGGFSSARAGMVISLMVVFSAPCQLLPGALERRLRRRRKGLFMVQLGSGWLGTALVTVGILIPGGGWLQATGLWLVAAAGGCTPLTTNLVREVSRPDCVGVALSSHNSVTFLLTAVFSNFSGIILELAGRGEIVRTATAVIYPRSSYAVLALLMLLALTVAWWNGFRVPETNGRSICHE